MEGSAASRKRVARKKHRTKTVAPCKRGKVQGVVVLQRDS